MRVANSSCVGNLNNRLKWECHAGQPPRSEEGLGQIKQPCFAILKKPQIDPLLLSCRVRITHKSHWNVCTALVARGEAVQCTFSKHESHVMGVDAQCTYCPEHSKIDSAMHHLLSDCHSSAHSGPSFSRLYKSSDAGKRSTRALSALSNPLMLKFFKYLCFSTPIGEPAVTKRSNCQIVYFCGATDASR